MAITHTLIQTITVGAGGTSSIDFSSIPQTYTDLLVLLSARTTQTAVGDDLYMYFNGVTTNRSDRFVYGNGSSALSTTVGPHVGTMTSNTATASVFGNAAIYICNYASTTLTKSISGDSVSENNATQAFTDLTASLWNSTAAITSIQIPTAAGRGVWMQYSSASLYGIKNS